MKLTLIRALVMVCFVATATVVRAERVYILHDAAVPQAAYAARKLSDALVTQKHEVLRDRKGYEASPINSGDLSGWERGSDLAGGLAPGAIGCLPESARHSAAPYQSAEKALIVT